MMPCLIEIGDAAIENDLQLREIPLEAVGQVVTQWNPDFETGNGIVYKY